MGSFCFIQFYLHYFPGVGSCREGRVQFPALLVRVVWCSVDCFLLFFSERICVCPLVTDLKIVAPYSFDQRNALRLHTSDTIVRVIQVSNSQLKQLQRKL